MFFSLKSFEKFVKQINNYTYDLVNLSLESNSFFQSEEFENNKYFKIGKADKQ